LREKVDCGAGRMRGVGASLSDRAALAPLIRVSARPTISLKGRRDP
jgi:hypothetical protein